MIFWSIKNLLAKISRRAAPDRSFVMSLRSTLHERGYLPMPKRYRFAAWKLGVASGSVIFTLMGTMTAAYAYSSPDVLPNHPLYGIRTGLESIETSLAQTSEDKARVNIKHLDRHLNESKRLLALNRSSVVVMRKQALLSDLDRVADAPVAAPEPNKRVSLKKQYAPQLLDIEKKELAELIDQEADADPGDEKKQASAALEDQMNQVQTHVRSLEEKDAKTDQQDEEFLKLETAD